WKKRYGGLLPDEMRRLKALEDENARLKKIVADLTLDREILQDVIRRKPLRPVRTRKLVDGLLVDWGVPIRRACQALRFDTSSYHYKSRRTGQAGLELRIRESCEICETRVRYGSRRIHVLLRWEGWQVNIRKTRRIYNELGLQLRNRHPKRRVKARLREDRKEAAGPNEVWAMDFVHDQLAPGKTLRILTIVDIHSRYCPAVDPRFACRGEDVVQTLERVCRHIGCPQTIRVDNGSEFISRDLDLWAYANDVTLDFSRPGKPTDNGFIEAFNSKLRSECLNAHWVMDLADAREKVEAWRRDDNEVRPHSAIGYNVPIDLHIPGGATSPPP
ncbi:IS3 family transposase, partial [Paracoccus sp. IB05]|uniref:IS3 family transposase n=1 Tax=Paracoccus sp. IB05 TaxID=2779367 RepID=UPI0018E7DAE7